MALDLPLYMLYIGMIRINTALIYKENQHSNFLLQRLSEI